MSCSSVTIFHNPRCSKSRQTLQLIREAGVEPDVVEYLKSPPSIAELDGILKKLNLAPLDLMRRKESVFSELGLADRFLTREEAIAIMVENPVLIERPIVVKGGYAVIGRPPENLNELLQ
ncbi:MAG: arsenate reductase (glutaredoxin) [Planctomycetota bacterium]|nr:arsenate reductase (glutaredoxin) [Planctomycetota bacterium]MDA1166165.1 arsenate reductase (glutaredoxin) [Planctomycetota bacterium]